MFRVLHDEGAASGHDPGTPGSTMNGLIFTTTATSGWKAQCEAWAVSRRPFEVHQVQTGHFQFCHDVCARHSYEYKYRVRDNHSVAIFCPDSCNDGKPKHGRLAPAHKI